ncbi:hypothetical protein GCM10017687_10310 [Streptomyces echinatus]
MGICVKVHGTVSGSVAVHALEYGAGCRQHADTASLALLPGTRAAGIEQARCVGGRETDGQAAQPAVVGGSGRAPGGLVGVGVAGTAKPQPTRGRPAAASAPAPAPAPAPAST